MSQKHTQRAPVQQRTQTAYRDIQLENVALRNRIHALTRQIRQMQVDLAVLKQTAQPQRVEVIAS